MTHLCQLERATNRFALALALSLCAISAVGCASNNLSDGEDATGSSGATGGTAGATGTGGATAGTGGFYGHKDCSGGGPRCRDGVAYTLPSLYGVGIDDSCEDGPRMDETICEYGCDDDHCAAPPGGGAGGMGAGGAAGEPSTGGASTGGARTGGASTGGAAGETSTGGASTGGAGGSQCGAGQGYFVPSCTPPTVTPGCYETCDDGSCTSGRCLELTVMPECALSCTDGCCAACAVGQALCIGDEDPPLCGDSRGFGTLTWGQNGGMVLFELSSTIEADNTFRLTRISYGGAPDVSCEPPLPECGSASLDLDDVTRAVLHRDVQRALRSGADPLLFGYDSRPVDGTVTRIVVDGVMLEVGTPCDGQTDCTPIPAGISRLAATLDALTTQQSVDGTCDGVRVE